MPIVGVMSERDPPALPVPGSTTTLVATPDRAAWLDFVAHELRNPLAAIVWASEQQARTPTGIPRIDRLAALNARAVRRLHALLDDWLAIERGHGLPGSGPALLGAVIDRATASDPIDPDGLTVECSPSLAALQVDLDADWLATLLRACVRRLVHCQGAGSVYATGTQQRAGELALHFTRTGIRREEVDPPAFTRGGADEAGTVLALERARQMCRLASLPVAIEDSPDGVRLTIRLPIGG